MATSNSNTPHTPNPAVASTVAVEPSQDPNAADAGNPGRAPSADTEQPPVVNFDAGTGDPTGQKKYQFTADYGVHLADANAQFGFNAAAGEKVSRTGQVGGVGSRTYGFETDDPKQAEAVRKAASGDNEYGITEVKS